MHLPVPRVRVRFFDPPIHADVQVCSRFCFLLPMGQVTRVKRRVIALLRRCTYRNHYYPNSGSDEPRCHHAPSPNATGPRLIERARSHTRAGRNSRAKWAFGKGLVMQSKCKRGTESSRVGSTSSSDSWPSRHSVSSFVFRHERRASVFPGPL